MKLRMSEAELRALFNEQDPLRKLSVTELDRAIPPIESLLAASETTPPRTPRGMRRLPRRVVIIGFAILLLAALTAATWIYFTTRPTSDPLGTLCYRSFSADAKAVVVGIEVGEGPEQSCARQWKETFRVEAPPELVACVLEDGGATAVLPNPEGLEAAEACPMLGGVVPQGDATYGGLSAEEVQMLDAKIAGWIATSPVHDCAPSEDLVAFVREALDVAGAEEWWIDDRTSAVQPWKFPDGTRAVVEVPLHPSGQTCAFYAVSAKKAKVMLTNSWTRMPSPPPEADR